MTIALDGPVLRRTPAFQHSVSGWLADAFGLGGACSDWRFQFLKTRGTQIKIRAQIKRPMAVALFSYRRPQLSGYKSNRVRWLGKVGSGFRAFCWLRA
jgi:hypothetical protein